MWLSFSRRDWYDPLVESSSVAKSLILACKTDQAQRYIEALAECAMHGLKKDKVLFKLHERMDRDFDDSGNLLQRRPLDLFWASLNAMIATIVSDVFIKQDKSRPGLRSDELQEPVNQRCKLWERAAAWEDVACPFC